MGIKRNNASCLQSPRLTAGLREKPADKSVSEAYAMSGQKKSGDAMRSARATCEATQHNAATVSRICETAIDSCAAATMPINAPSPISSTRSRVGVAVVMEIVVTNVPSQGFLHVRSFTSVHGGSFTYVLSRWFTEVLSRTFSGPAARARWAASITCSTVIDVKQRKSPGTQ